MIVDATFTYDGGGALSIDDSGAAYIADGSGGFTTSANGSATGGFFNTVADYVNVALATGGAAWDLNLLRAGANTAASFTESFLAIKVEEITTQPPSGNVIPLPAVGWLLLGGLGGLAAMTRRKKA